MSLKSTEFCNVWFGRTEAASFATQKVTSMRVFPRDLTSVQRSNDVYTDLKCSFVRSSARSLLLRYPRV